MKTQLSSQDWQQLSSYLDGQLLTSDKERVEKRLHDQPEMQSALEELRRNRILLRSMPRRKVPHNFVITRAMAAQQAMHRSIWYPVFSALSFVFLAMFGLVTLLTRIQINAAPIPVAMQAASSDRVQDSSPEATPMIILWGSGGVGGGGGDGNVVPQAANPLSGAYGFGEGPPLETQAAPMMKSQATPEPGLEAAPLETEASIPGVAAPNSGDNPEVPTNLSQPAISPTAESPLTDNTLSPTDKAGAQEKSISNLDNAPVQILGIAATQEQGLVQETPAPLESSPVKGSQVNSLPFVQGGLIVLALTAGILALTLKKKS